MSVCVMEVHINIPASMIPPQFSDRLQTKEVKEGESVKFTVKISGKPPPTVTWYREGSKIVSSADFEIQQDGDLYSLYIPEVFYEDSGKFAIKAENPAGQTQCTAELIVEGNNTTGIIIDQRNYRNNSLNEFIWLEFEDFSK